MCGIVGLLSRDQEPSALERTVVAMRDQMRHRGPDDAGVTVLRDGERLLALGHRRLSIIDVSPLGHQPMSTADGALWIVFNGEIFNYRELREQLPPSVQAEFRSQSDTEVILYAVREWGIEECLRRLRGMYAFALYDGRSGLLTLVRDPLGVKPLYYVHDGRSLAFASEIKALLAMPNLARTIDNRSLYHYLTFANAPAPYTFFEGVLKLEAGTYLTVDRQGRVAHRRYWDPVPYSTETTRLTEQECIEEIRRLLRRSVKRRMVSDVPFGVFLSGGVDSSLNVALMAELLNRPVETFSIGIKDDPTNEFEHARQVARHFKTHHHEAVIDDHDFISFLPDMARLQDEPVADPVCVPIYYISRLARESSTPVIQVGEGSDEIFAGYQTYHLFDGWNRQLDQPYLHIPDILRQSLYAVGKHFLPAETQDALRRAGAGEPLFLGNAIAFWDNEKAGLLKREFLSDETSSRFIDRLEQSLHLGDPLSRIIQIELKNRLPELLLMRVDKMSMANSIETRVPFLDEDLVAFALSIPSALKYKHGRPKYILKEAARGIIPDSIIDRKKWGFCGSATNMLSPSLVEFAKPRILDNPLIAERFHRSAIERLFHALRTQKRFNSFKIWNLLNLALWHEQWFAAAARRSVA